MLLRNFTIQYELLMKCCKQLGLEDIGEPNLGGPSFPEQSQYWCIPNNRLRDMFVGKEVG